jgi:hypothetical protein
MAGANPPLSEESSDPASTNRGGLPYGRANTMAAKNQVSVTADPGRNLLHLSYAGDIRLKEIQRLEKDIEMAVTKMSQGFFLLTDFTDLNSMDLVCVPYIKKTMDGFRKAGVARIVRVIPDPHKDIGFNIMSLFHYPRGLLIITCENQAEADRALT